MVHAMAASLGLNPEAFFNPCSSYSSASSPFMAVDYTPSFPADDRHVDASFSAELEDHRRLFDFEYSPAASIFAAGVSAGDGHNGKKMRHGSDEKRARVNGRIGFRTRSEVEVLDDGFKWRKYGKKAVKNSPNPRNYYRCSADGCGVKKRVERDRDDPRYVVTTYDGVHNHASPAVAVIQQYGGGGVGFYSRPHGGSSAPAASYSSGSLLF